MNYFRPSTQLKRWMKRVLKEYAGARRDIKPHYVHHLRTALRRCNTIQKSLFELTQDKDFQKVGDLGRPLFKQLSDLRDIHVMINWTKKLLNGEKNIYKNIYNQLKKKEKKYEKKVKKALDQFDLKKWNQLIKKVSSKNVPYSLNSRVFQNQALKRLNQTLKLHRYARLNPTPLNYHKIRIQHKHLRYVVENFLPEYQAHYGKKLKYFHDLFGDMHDLDALIHFIHENIKEKKVSPNKKSLSKLKQAYKSLEYQYLQLTKTSNSTWFQLQKRLQSRKDF